MLVCFRIHYHTQWGQHLKVVGDHLALGQWNVNDAPEMHYQEDGMWELSLDLPSEKAFSVAYKYVLVEPDGRVLWEWGVNRQFAVKADKYEILRLNDAWRENAKPENAWFSSAFTGVLMRRDGKKGPQRRPTPPHHRFQIAVPRLAQDQTVCVLGSDPALGGWEEDKAVVMSEKDYPLFTANVKLKDPAEPVAYKYALYNKAEKRVIEWEAGDDRVLSPISLNGQALLDVHTDEQFRYPNENWRGTGVAIPVFSLRSQQGMGTGEFNDLRALIDWAVQTELKLVQILPINDTTANHTWEDCYPYAAISVFALNPLFLNVEQMGKLADKALQKEFDAERKRLNALEVVDHEAVMQAKWRYIHLYFAQERKGILADKSFQKFIQENRDWLLPYAAFCAFRDRYETPDFSKWGADSLFDEARISSLVSPENDNYDEFAIHLFVQYHLHTQLLEVAEYARSKGIVFKGDIPIGIYRYSVDAWVAPHLYNMNAQAGAPPDAFAVAGQNWGFPTYNWHEMAKDGYSWWRARLSQMATYFDTYRIDHILGFFRIWEIPYHAIDGLLGHFNPALPLSMEEITQRLGWFDYDRLCQPYIRAHLLEGLFGEMTEWVKEEFLEEYQPGHFHLKSHVSTQRQVEQLLKLGEGATQETKDIHYRLKSGLFELITNVLLLEAPLSNGQAFNPRISIQQTSSFKDLDPGSRERLSALYLDYFYHRHEDFWRAEAMTKLPEITTATSMLVCGEDLGMVPDCVPGVMEELGMLSLEIQRMPKETGRHFGHPADAPYLSVVSPSSHDMSTVRGWWEEDRAVTQQFYNEVLKHPGDAPFYCEPWICQEILEHHLASPAMWAIFPLQDLLAIDGDLRIENPHAERINVPANPKHYWQYRMHLDLETLAAEKEFNKGLKDLVKQAGR